jgi:trehalose/maltose hydrolase-like predicted phosphorylase
VSATSGRQISEGNGGKIMYSQEFWMLPLVSLFNTDMSKNLIQSRLRRGYNTDSLNVFEKAREWAKNENYQGLRYAWEQGDFGDEVSSLQDAKQKIHTGASIRYRSFLFYKNFRLKLKLNSK